jgi:hypothetical protein
MGVGWVEEKANREKRRGNGGERKQKSWRNGRAQRKWENWESILSEFRPFEWREQIHFISFSHFPI